MPWSSNRRRIGYKENAKRALLCADVLEAAVRLGLASLFSVGAMTVNAKARHGRRDLTRLWGESGSKAGSSPIEAPERAEWTAAAPKKNLCRCKS